MDRLRQRGDQLGDEAVEYLVQDTKWCSDINAWERLPSQIELFDFPKPLRDFFGHYHTTPDFVQPKGVEAAQAFFEKEANIYLSLLGLYSLPYCYAFPDGAQVLVRSKRILGDVGRRLSETAFFVMEAFCPGMFLTHNVNLISLAKVRLIHGFSRHFIRKYSSDWDNTWGIPINQEDMLGTNLAFSLMVVRGMEKLDRFPGRESLENILHYWKLVGYYLGLDVSFWPDDSKEAFECEKMIRRRHLRPSEAGRILTKSLTEFYRNTLPDKLLASSAEVIVGYPLGKDAAQAVGLPCPTVLPKPVFGFVYELGIGRHGTAQTSYQAIRREMSKRYRAQFGKELTLDIPVPMRP